MAGRDKSLRGFLALFRKRNEEPFSANKKITISC